MAETVIDMGISYNAQEQVFRLDTPHTTYLIGIAEGFLGQIYYGPRIPDSHMRYLLRLDEPPYTPSRNAGERAAFYDVFPFEYPAWGNGDFREPCLRIETGNGGRRCELFYQSHKIFAGKKPLDGLPAAFGRDSECSTLEILCCDPALNLQVILSYTVFETADAICRSARIENNGAAPLTLTSALSACLTLDGRNFDIITLPGAWAHERRIDRRPVSSGKQGAFSLRGISSHQFNPFLALAERAAAQEYGLVYGMCFVYSGNFLAQAEQDACGTIRAVLGIHPDGFSWRLESGEAFQTPEAVLVCSNTGLGGMSRSFHDFFREHLIRGQRKHRYSLVNSWEAAYFDFDHDRLLALGQKAAEAGIEMLVVDDGWFGRRDDDTTSLGDWSVNEKKLPGGFKRLGEELSRLGVKLGIWIEPEMVSPDSDLYRAHPDYALQIPDRAPTLSRSQYVLDLTRQEVRDCVYDQLSAVLRSAPVDYLKWDMNRGLTDVFSTALPAGRQGETAHRYTLGLYELQERLLTDFPDLLLENCCSGGGRFDAGMLYYSPQIWASDNAEAIDRLIIQEGTALVYPLSSMGAHIAACPSHTNRRSTPFRTRGLVSLTGCFGYELDLSRLSPEELAMIPEQLAEYREYGPVFRDGDAYRLASFAENHCYDALLGVAKDQSLAVLNYVQVSSRAQQRSLRLPLAGLDTARMYRNRQTGETRSGAGWMYGGILLPALDGDFQGLLIVLEGLA